MKKGDTRAALETRKNLQAYWGKPKVKRSPGKTVRRDRRVGMLYGGND